MEQQLDATYLRPSFLSKPVALSAASLGVGAAILLGSFGLSLIWRPSPPTSVDLKLIYPEFKIKQDEPFLFKAVEGPTKPELPIPKSAEPDATSHGEVIRQDVQHVADVVQTQTPINFGNSGGHFLVMPEH